MAASAASGAKRQRRWRNSPMKAAPPTSMRPHDHASPLSSGTRSDARRAEYSGNSKNNTTADMLSETVSATAEPVMIRIKTDMGRIGSLAAVSDARHLRSAA